MLFISLLVKSQDLSDCFFSESNDTITINDLFTKPPYCNKYLYDGYDETLIASDFDFKKHEPYFGKIDSLCFFMIYKNDSSITKIRFEDKRNDIRYELEIFQNAGFKIYMPYILSSDGKYDRYWPNGFFIYDIKRKINVFFGIDPRFKNIYENPEAVYMSLILDKSLNPTYRVNWFMNDFVSCSSLFFLKEKQLYEVVSLYSDLDCIEKYSLNNLTINKLYKISKHGLECPIITNISAKPSCAKKKPFWNCNRFIYYYD